jgi:Pectate lyase superfamily protein
MDPASRSGAWVVGAPVHCLSVSSPCKSGPRKDHFRSGVISLLALAFSCRAFAVESPVVIWASDPVRPGETVLLMGENFSRDSFVELIPLSDGEGTAAPDAAIPGSERIAPIQVGEHSLKFVVPEGDRLGAWVCDVRNGRDASSPVMLNVADVWWNQGDHGDSASPGGWLRVFGKSLNLGGHSRAKLLGANGVALELKSVEADDYALRFELPASLEAGEYKLTVHNGLGGGAGWKSAGAVMVRPHEPWKTDIFNVKDFGPKPAEALLAALKKAEANGGGIVYLPRGRYPVQDRLVIPPNTVLKGEAMEIVSLYWPDFDTPPKELITGSNFGVESLSIYCQNHKNVVADTSDSRGVFLRRVRIRANCYFGIEEAGQEFRNRRGPASQRESGAAVWFQGRNFEVTDCDIYASNYALRIMRGKVGVIARNRLLYGGRGYSIENTDRLIIEDNLVSGDNLIAIGNDVTTFWNNYCRNIYFAHNHVQQMFGADREMMTLDAGGGAYFGKIVGVAGAKLTLANDPVFHDYAPKPHTNWEGAAVMILDGKGAGQYRFVTANDGRAWEVDRPWSVEPDATSLISIAPFRGRDLFIGNTFEDGGPFQLYGAAFETIVAENKGARMDGFFVIGLNPHGWGHQPSWYCQFLDNQILEGNGYGSRSANFGARGDDESKTFDGPMVRGPIFRRDRCLNNSAIQIGPSVEDAIVEHCVVENNDRGIVTSPKAGSVLLRENRFLNVANPLVVGEPSRTLVIEAPNAPAPAPDQRPR